MAALKGLKKVHRYTVELKIQAVRLSLRRYRLIMPTSEMKMTGLR